MASTVLGKRSRGSRQEGASSVTGTGNHDLSVSRAAVALPSRLSKRMKGQARSSPMNDENADPQDASAAEQLNEDDEAVAAEPHIAEEARVERYSRPFSPVTPSKPRFRDALAREPTTPRHRVMPVGKISKRQTPGTPLTPSSVQTVYHEARQLFSRSAVPGQLVGREDEKEKLRAFLERCSTSKPSGCIYVSGPPGTGKSAMVNEATQEAAESLAVKRAYVNCMRIKSSKDLYATLVDLLCDGSEATEADATSALEKVFLPRQKSSDVFLVVLDEIDHILTLDHESLYRVFEWSLQKTSRLVLIGIANALDLTDRFLPRLKSRHLKPELLPFLPYSATQIKTIITARLRTLTQCDQVPFIHPAAIDLCSRKVASQTGDLRKAFDICRRAIDVVEMETRHKHEAETQEKVFLATPSRKVLGEKNNLTSSAEGGAGINAFESLAVSLRSLTAANAPRATIAHLNKITAATFSNGTSQRLKTLNLQQKAVLCSLIALERRNRACRTSLLATPSRSRSAAPSIKTLFETYRLLCKRDAMLQALSSAEFREVMGSLETLSLIAAVDGKTGSFTVTLTPSKRAKNVGFGAGVGLGDEKKVASCVGEKEMEVGCEGPGSGILQSILSGEALE